jgi:hypothetical protein
MQQQQQQQQQVHPSQAPPGGSYPENGGTLDPAVVKRAAQQASWIEVLHNPYIGCISFTPLSRDISVIVYYNSGTVGVSIDHPRMGRSTIFRHSQSINQLSELFKQPRLLPEVRASFLVKDLCSVSLKKILVKNSLGSLTLFF